MIALPCIVPYVHLAQPGRWAWQRIGPTIRPWLPSRIASWCLLAVRWAGYVDALARDIDNLDLVTSNSGVSPLYERKIDMPAILDRPLEPSPGVLDNSPFEPIPLPAPRLRRHWWHFHFPWIKTAVGAPMGDETLLIDNRTAESWRLHLGYRDLGAVASYHQHRVVTARGGMLSARQVHAAVGTAYLTLPLTSDIRVIEILHDDRHGTPFYQLHALESGQSRP